MNENNKIDELTKYYSLFFYIALSVWAILYLIGIIFLGVDPIIGLLLLIMCFVFPVVILDISNFQIKLKLQNYDIPETELERLKKNKKKINIKLSDILVGGFTAIFDCSFLILIFLLSIATNLTVIFGISLMALIIICISLIFLETLALVIYILMRNNIILNHILNMYSANEIKELKDKKSIKKDNRKKILKRKKEKEIIRESKKNGKLYLFKKNKLNLILYILAIIFGIIGIIFAYNLIEHIQRFTKTDGVIDVYLDIDVFNNSSFFLLFYEYSALNYISRAFAIIFTFISLVAIVLSFIVKKKIIGAIAIFVGYFSQFISLIDCYKLLDTTTLLDDSYIYTNYFPEITLNIFGLISIIVSAILFIIILVKYIIVRHNTLFSNEN